MKFFKRRDCEEYQTELETQLDLDNLKKTAHELNNGAKLISIDFFGISATTLFDAGGNYAKTHVYKELKKLLFSYNELNKKGYFIRIRLLFEYPYSISSYSRIQAEFNSDRASMDETAFSRKFHLTESIDIDLYKGSRLVTNQMASLIRVQSLMDELEKKESWKKFDWNDIELKNKITLRFTPINPSFCCLFINNKAYYDVYLMAKKDRYHNSLDPFSPTCYLESKEDSEEISAFKDHFRYLWDLDTTMHYKDATKYNPKTINSLAKIKPPYDIVNDYRANKILNYNIQDFTQEDANRWSTISRKNILKYCADLSPENYDEVMFVTCSWIRDSDNEPKPNLVVEELVTKMLSEDFYYQKKKIIDFRILRAATTDYLDEQLYSGLDSATLGLVVLTKDIEDKDGKTFYCRPNVYHELGYLMNRLGKHKIIILKEEGTSLPSNVQNIPYIPFKRENLKLRYLQIIEAIRTIGSYSPLVQIEALNNHLKRLQNALNEDEIKQREFKTAKTKIENLITELKSAPNNV